MSDTDDEVMQAIDTMRDAEDAAIDPKVPELRRKCSQARDSLDTAIEHARQRGVLGAREYAIPRWLAAAGLLLQWRGTPSSVNVGDLLRALELAEANLEGRREALEMALAHKERVPGEGT